MKYGGIILGKLEDEIKRRRTFAIISHPDAGKTTLTEKFLLYGGAIAQAGAVKGKKNSRHAVSDWMEIEKQRGISVTSSVMQFQYKNYCINILDTPGHQDFSEDTYRTLMAADSAVMVIDASKGVENQTRKLFKVCVMRHIPIFTFVNKMDRESRNPFDLMEQIESELGIQTYPVNWPIGSGKEFKGVYDRDKKHIISFEASGGQHQVAATEVDLSDPSLDSLIGEDLHSTLCDDIELLDGASYEFDIEKVRKGELSPVFFGSALTNFGVEPFLENFLEMTTSPTPRNSSAGIIDPFDPEFSAFVFKIQANMNKAHRDRITFLRICSGKFDKDMEVLHVQGNKKLRLSQPQQIMAQEREIIDEAYAGDIIGLPDNGTFKIGDTLTEGELLHFRGLPSFSPEMFKYIENADPMKQKQLAKGIDQLMDEGVAQLFVNQFNGRKIIGTVGQLQFEVIQYRLLNEYNASCRWEPVSLYKACWVESDDPAELEAFKKRKYQYMAKDREGRDVFLADSGYVLQMAQMDFKHIKFHFTSEF
mgnify:CR=1 FL=1